MILLGIFIANPNEKLLRWLMGLFKKEKRQENITPP
jgi:hypothetical protein